MGDKNMEKNTAVIDKKSIKRNLFIGLMKYFTVNTLVFMCISFLLSKSIVVYQIAPLGIAFFVCMQKYDRYRMPIFISTMIGILLSNNLNSYIIKYSICAVFFLLFGRIIRKSKNIFMLSSIYGVVVFLVAGVQLIILKGSLLDVMLATLESVIFIISVNIFYYGADFLANIKNRISVRAEETISMSIIFIFALMGIGNATLFGISIRTVIVTSVLLLTSTIGGSSIGAGCGVIVGLVYFLNDLTTAFYMGIYAFSGMITGVFSKVNKYLSMFVFIVSWFCVYNFTTGLNINATQIRDMLIGCILVILIPKKILTKISRLIKSTVDSDEIVTDYIIRSRKLITNRLNSIYKTYENLAGTFEKIREKERVLDNMDIASLVQMVHDEECYNCSMYRMCWNRKANYTYKLMCNLLDSIEESGEMFYRSIPEEFSKECLKPEQVAKMASYYYRLFSLDYNWSRKFVESRKVISNQIINLSKSIEDISKDIEKNLLLDLEKEKELYDSLQREGIEVDKVNYLMQANGEFEIEIEQSSCIDRHLCDKKIAKILSEVLGECLSVKKYSCNGINEKCRSIFVKTNKFSVVTEVAQMSRNGDLLCGDNYTFMEVNDGKYMMAISDGMGKDKKASEESSATIDILEKMIDSKINNEIIVDTINNLLMLKSTEEMFSTLDFGMVDLRKGYLDTIKMGACSSYIKRKNNEIDLISSSSLPVGILSDIHLDRKTVKLNDGDFVIMVSDGIIDAGRNKNLGDNWLIYFLETLDFTNPRIISDKILNRAFELQPDGIEDDMTVLVSKVYTV
ncbi:MAG: stage II sporulation protein E [Clostridioides sp.]|jgi:stage II sporulation protein E|nr:stage II sporulation protein E [Clostridioides sp.]